MWSLRRQSKKQHLSLMNKECYLVSGGQRVVQLQVTGSMLGKGREIKSLRCQ